MFRLTYRSPNRARVCLSVCYLKAGGVFCDICQEGGSANFEILYILCRLMSTYGCHHSGARTVTS